MSAFLAAGAALKVSAAEAHVHDVSKAYVIIGKALEELADRELRRGGRTFLAHRHYMQ